MKPVLELRNVSKQFHLHGFANSGKSVHAMNDVSIELAEGEILGLVGESGSGKTTTASAIARLFGISGGEILFNGERLQKRLSRKNELQYRKKVQVIFQDPFSSLNPTHTILSILERPFVIHGISKKRKELKELVSSIIVQVGLEPPSQFLDKFPHELSGGQRQRINIARTFSVDPQIILADEPTSMLDVSIRMSIMNMMLEYQEKKSVSFIYITHDLAGARYMSNRIAVMYAGMIMEIGNADEIIKEAFHPYTRLLKSAAPDPEKELKRQKLITKGDIPSLINPPPGCRFSPRCPYAEEICFREIPIVKKISKNHYARCIL